MDRQLNSHYRQVGKILVIVLMLNWAVAVAKIVYGLIIKSSSMTADGLHSLSDGASNIIGLIGIFFASQPKDSDHPYGHKKYETFFALGIGALLFFVAINLFKQGIGRLIHQVVPQVDIASFAIMVATTMVNFSVMRYEASRGRSLKSDILVSDSLHTRADILTSVSVIVALSAVKLGYPIIDPVVTILISLFIAYAGFEIIKEGSQVLCDAIAIVDNKQVTSIVMCVKGVKACHKIRTRGRQDDINIDLHVQVAPNMHVDEAHKICYAIEDAIKKGISGVTDVVVHIEPKEK